MGSRPLPAVAEVGVAVARLRAGAVDAAEDRVRRRAVVVRAGGH